MTKRRIAQIILGLIWLIPNVVIRLYWIFFTPLLALLAWVNSDRIAGEIAKECLTEPLYAWKMIRGTI